MTNIEKIAAEAVLPACRHGKRQSVRQAMMKRCEEQGHEWVNCCSLLFEIYQECKWCGEKRDT